MHTYGEGVVGANGEAGVVGDIGVTDGDVGDVGVTDGDVGDVGATDGDVGDVGVGGGGPAAQAPSTI